MKIRNHTVGAVFTAILMTLISLTSTAQQVTVSPSVSYFFQPKEATIIVSGSRQSENTNLLAKVRFIFSEDPVMEKLPAPELGPAKDHPEALVLRDLSMNSQGHINLLVGTFRPKIMSFNGKAWTTVVDSSDVWGLQNNTTAGGFAADDEGNFFLPGMWIVQSRTGVYKTSPAEKQFKLFAEGLQPMDLCVRDGIIYAVEDKQDSTKAILLDAKTGALKKEVPLPKGDHRAITIAKDGSMFIADLSGVITHINPDGKFIAQTVITAHTYNDEDVRPVQLGDIDLSPDGQFLAIGSADGYVGILPVDLKQFQLHRLGTFCFGTFVAWPP
jgi:hypothetical protein